METKINIHIPDPCPENWNLMIPSEKGRFCDACNKVVVDFTRMDTEDIIRYFKDMQGTKVCGHFRDTQLTQPIAKNLAKRRMVFLSPLQRIVAILVTGITFFLSSCKPSTTGEPSMNEIERDSITSTTHTVENTLVKKDTLVKNNPIKPPRRLRKKIETVEPPPEIIMGVSPVTQGGVDIEFIPPDSL
jgi:hypothetical protein